MKRAFTLIELLVVIAIIAILAAILFPVFAQAKAAAKAAADLSNTKEHATAIAIYTADADDTYPLEAGWTSSQWGYNYMKLFPWDWPVPDGGGISNRMQYSQVTYMNSIQPYMKNTDMCVATGAPVMDHFHACQSYPLAVGKVEYKSTYAYNGFLNDYPTTSVANPALCPIITEQNGFCAGVGVTFANPALVCDDPNQDCIYKPWSSTCTSGIGHNGQVGWMYQAFGAGTASYWCNKKGENFAMTDGHAKFRNVGMQLTPNLTDANVDPMVYYNADGTAGSYWWDGCHAWLFRPDYDQ